MAKTKKKNEVPESATSSKKVRSVKHPAKKGKSFENEVANLLRHIFPEAERHLEYQASKVTGVDLDGTGPYRIQCKNYASYCPIGKIREIRDTGEGIVPVLVTKGIRMEPVACLYLKDFIEMLEKIEISNKTQIETLEEIKIDTKVLAKMQESFGIEKAKSDGLENFI